ncbi:hypothetical protein B296_00048112 [Ensete ventricosum]|uniref:CNNM transmembrane domain-containing protein n=1 Tax=Ensete ventricosum TaxID=4639 RepID=A0A426YW89_ENSVE|nr:hypothetical protein B296_00048112 [Ensete ventricosum]
MHAVNAMTVARGTMMMMAAAAAGVGCGGKGETVAVLQEAEDVPFGTAWWYIFAGISCFLVLFAGIMSGLTLGLMSLGLVDLEILQRSGTPTEKKQAGPSVVASLASCISCTDFVLDCAYLYQCFLIKIFSSLPASSLKYVGGGSGSDINMAMKDPFGMAWAIAIVGKKCPYIAARPIAVIEVPRLSRIKL